MLLNFLHTLNLLIGMCENALNTKEDIETPAESGATATSAAETTGNESTSVSGAGKQTGNSSNDNDHSGKSEKEEAASIVVETTGSESSEESKTGNGKAEDSSEAATSDKIVVAPKAEAKESEQQEVPDSNEVENHENKSGKNTCCDGRLFF